MPETVAPGANQPAPLKKGRTIQLTPELVKKITERVYALILAEIKIDRERRRLSSSTSQESGGGPYAI
jgi:hypothetical protein